MSNPSLESCCVVVFKYYDHFSCNIFADVSSFFIDFWKNASCGIIQPHSTLVDVFHIFSGHQWVILSSSFKMLKNEVIHAQGGSGSKIFSLKIWIIIKKLSTCQQKMNDNNVISFYILKELLNSFQTSGNEFWDNKRFSRYRETIIAKTFNENDVITEKCWRTLKNEVIMKIFGPILITFIIVPSDFSQGLLEVPDVLGGWGYFLLPSPHNHWMSNWKPN